MPTYDCDDFRVSFDRASDDTYSVSAVAADGTRVSSRFTMPMETGTLEAAVLQLGRSRSREVPPAAVEAVRANAEQLGGELGHALFDGRVGHLYDEARRSAAASGRGLRLTLSLASTPELLSVPWELLYRRPNFLASQRRTPVVRYLEVGDLPPPLRIDGPVRVLGVVSSPAGLPPLDVEDERARVEDALSSMVDRGLVVLDWCDPASPRSLRERLRDDAYHVLHYVGHSDFTPEGDGLLFLVNDAGGPAQVTEAVLTNLLGDQTSLRLAVLNSCEGARTTLTDPFAGIATGLVALGVPAVVAMQFTISDRAAIVFAEELFTSLIGRQYPIDAAVSEARKAVFTEVNEIEWATPVLFLRSADGQLFDFTAAPEALPLAVGPSPLTAENPDVDAPVPTLPPPPPPPDPPPDEQPQPDPPQPDPPQPTPPQPTPPQDPPSPGQPWPLATALRQRRRRRIIIAGAVAAALIAGGVAVALVVPPGDPASTSTDPTSPVDPTTGDTGTDQTTAITDPATTVSGTVPFPGTSTTCAGQPAPPRPAPVGLTGTELQAFETSQAWIDELAEVQPNADNSARLTTMEQLFPGDPFATENGLSGYANMAVQHLIPVGVTSDGTGSLSVMAGGLVYDDPSSSTPCRSGFLCYRFRVAGDGTHIEGIEFGRAFPGTPGAPYWNDRWLASTDPNPYTGTSTVADSMVTSCPTAAYSRWG